MQATQRNTTIIGFVTLSMSIGMVAISGIPPTVDTGVFLLGLALLVGTTLATLFAGWWLLLRPLPAGQKAKTELTISRTQRWIIGLLLIVSLSFYTLGIAWDEVWHVKYGIPFGDDFLWRPHQLLYAGLLIIMGLGLYSWWIILRVGTGTLSQRFRGVPMFGIIALNAVLFVYAIPADPAWHEIYGEDLTALSIPHVLVILLAVIGLLAGCGIVFPLLQKRRWQVFWKIDTKTWLILLAYTSLLIMLTSLLTSDWFGLQADDLADETLVIFSRPAFPLALFLGFISVWVGALAVQSTGLWGAATCVGILAVLIRFSLNSFLGYFQPYPYPWLMQLGVLLAIDLLYLWQHNKTSWWMIALVGGASASMTTLPLINVFFAYPDITGQNLISMVIACFVGAGYGAWLGHVIGDYFSEQASALDSTQHKESWLIGAVLAGSTLFMILFVLTASPPA